MSHYGKLSMQPVSGQVKGFPQFHIIHRDNNEGEINKFFEHKMTATLWHHDVSYERQPPGYIMLGILACPVRFALSVTIYDSPNYSLEF